MKKFTENSPKIDFRWKSSLKNSRKVKTEITESPKVVVFEVTLSRGLFVLNKRSIGFLEEADVRGTRAWGNLTCCGLQCPLEARYRPGDSVACLGIDVFDVEVSLTRRSTLSALPTQEILLMAPLGPAIPAGAAWSGDGVPGVPEGKGEQRSSHFPPAPMSLHRP